ncbi:MAG: glycosyltransferase family 39 protein [bacterium]|nr:glycosyltransferase family 39 protein [bacterium]
MTKKQIHKYLFYIFILSLLLSMANAFYFNPVLDKDSIGYMRMAKYIGIGNVDKACQIRPEIPMLYQYILSLGIKIGFPLELFGRFLSIICGALLTYLTFYIARFFLSDKFSLVASLLLACNPLLIDSNAAILRDSFSVFIIGLSIYFLLSAVKKFGLYKYILAGIFAGFSAQTRIAGLDIVAFFPLYICFSFIFFRKYDQLFFYKNIIIGFIIFTATFFVITLPIQYYFAIHGSTYTIFLGRKLLDTYLI